MYTDFQFTLFSVITDYQCRVNFGYTPTLISNVVYTDVIYNLNEIFLSMQGMCTLICSQYGTVCIYRTGKLSQKTLLVPLMTPMASTGPKATVHLLRKSTDAHLSNHHHLPNTAN